jgi:signal transduction histidine kinase
LWEQWTGDPAWSAHGRTSIVTRSGTTLIVWLVSHDVLVACIVDAQQIQADWLAQMQQVQSGQIGIALVSNDGRYVVGQAGESPAHPTIRLASTTDLPWNLEVFHTGDIDTGWRARRNLLTAGIAVLFAFILTGAWFIGRSVNRELAVARLQSDFVAEVSHEFRTPLTALCQLSELLKRGRVATDQDRLEYYELLYSESHRLHRLVEGLLNFGRLESGKWQFHFEDLDAAALIRESVDEFAATQHARGYHFELTAQAESSVIPADREALGCVFWNLFENAVKYSPECETVWVDLAKNGKQVVIAVRDRGIGVGPRERHRIFGKFVRGSAARDRGIRGTGIGLALARQIVRAHGGDITLESELGKGSTFRVLLPLSKA